MNNAEIFVDHKMGQYNVKVAGRATFAIGPTLRDLVKSIERESSIKGINIDLTKCTGMDSTFMGILAMLALKVRKDNITVKIINAGQNRKLLNGLGLQKLFNYVEEEVKDNDWKKKTKEDKTATEDAETVLEAHKVLMEADESNVDKFKNVVDMVEKELEE